MSEIRLTPHEKRLLGLFYANKKVSLNDCLAVYKTKEPIASAIKRLEMAGYIKKDRVAGYWVYNHV